MTEEIPTAFLRLFIAITVPSDVREAIERAQSQLKRHSPPGMIRWTPPDRFHTTLKFLGDVPATQVPDLKEAVTKVCAGFPVLQLSARGVGFFPSLQKPLVIWVGTHDESEQLEEMHRRIDEAVRPFAAADKPDKFTGHITLGRFKPGHRGETTKLMERATILQARHFGDWVAGEVELFRSELTPTGAEHIPVASIPLSGSKRLPLLP